MFELNATDALLIVDVQNDFAHPDGSLYVPDGETIISLINEWIDDFYYASLPIHFTSDRHPDIHISFDTWPRHCVQGTWGARIHEDIKTFGKVGMVLKGQDEHFDQYSAFHPRLVAEDDEVIFTGLERALRNAGSKRVFVCGLATDYCVKATVLDALERGFEVIVLKDVIKGVGLEYDDVAVAIGEMVLAGARFI